ncbi:MAG: hypothetical protein AAFZ18_12985 [Myxococcota bacterium]
MVSDGGGADAETQPAYEILQGTNNHLENTGSCSRPGVAFGEEGVFETTLRFAFSAFGTIYPAGARVLVQRDGALLIGAPSPLPPRFELDDPPPTGVLIAAHASPFDRDSGEVYVSSESAGLAVSFCGMAPLGGEGQVFVQVEIQPGNQRVVVRAQDRVGTFDAAAGMADAEHTVKLACSPRCNFDPFTIFAFIPIDIPQVGIDLRWVTSSGLPESVAPGAGFVEPTYVVENAGNVDAPSFIYRPYLVPETGTIHRVGPNFGDLSNYPDEIGPPVDAGSTATVAFARTLVAPNMPGRYRFVVWLDASMGVDLDPTNDTFVVGSFEVTN